MWYNLTRVNIKILLNIEPFSMVKDDDVLPSVQERTTSCHDLSKRQEHKGTERHR